MIALTPESDLIHLVRAYVDSPEEEVRQRHLYRATLNVQGTVYTVYGETPQQAGHNIVARVQQAEREGHRFG